jgi:hypothetical protein
MENFGKLTQILERLNSGEDREEVKYEAQQFLASISPEDLTFAEHELVAAGLQPEDLRHLCSVHMGMLEGEVDRLKASLAPGHPVHTMIAEHELILGFLDDLERVNASVQSMKAYDASREEWPQLRGIAHHLIEAEKHHQREEDVLFPNVEERGLYGPPQVMRMEHVELRARKKELQAIVDQVDALDFAEFKSRLNTVAKFITLTLRDHIFKENNILYPAAVQVIPDDAQWARMKEECDRIGYCCFTPKG